MMLITAKSNLVKITTVGICLCVTLLGGGCKQAETAYHEGARLAHENLPLPALAHKLVELGSPKVTVKHVHESWMNWSDTKRTQNGDALIYTCEDYFSGKSTKVTIRNNDLTVDDKNYGVLKDGDLITVKSNKVRINDKEVQQIASR